MSTALRLHQDPPDRETVATATAGATTHTHNLLLDAVEALKELRRGNAGAADDKLKLVLLACANARSMLQPALLPPPKAQVDAALAEFRS